MQHPAPRAPHWTGNPGAFGNVGSSPGTDASGRRADVFPLGSSFRLAGNRCSGSAHAHAALLVGIATIAWLIGSIGLQQRWFWCDELLSANFSTYGPLAALAKALRFDVHPPLYYLQLSCWMLLGQSHEWLSANALFWHSSTAALLGWIVGRSNGLRVGALAGLLFALSPASLVYSDQLRMYGLLSFLLLLSWHAQCLWLRGGGRGTWLVISQVAVIWTHAIGLLLLVGLWTQAVLHLRHGSQRHQLRAYLRLLIIVLASAAPTLVVGTLRAVTHPTAPDFGDIAQVFRFLAGLSMGSDLLAVSVVGSISLILGLGIVLRRDLALRFACLVLAPMVVLGAVSHLLRPVWIERVFVPLVPFLCMLLAISCAEICTSSRSSMTRRLGVAAGATLLAVWAWLSIETQLTRPKGDGYRVAVEHLRANTRPGDMVVVDEDYDYWCLQWWWSGAGWGDPRQAYNDSDSWRSLMRKLPGATAEILGLDASHRMSVLGGVVVVLRDRDRVPVQTSGRLFLVRPPTSEVRIEPGWVLQERHAFSPVLVEAWTRTELPFPMETGVRPQSAHHPITGTPAILVDAAED